MGTWTLRVMKSLFFQELLWRLGRMALHHSQEVMAFEWART